MHAIILAGGFGTRLRAKVPEVPKPLAPISGKPFLAWLLEHLARSGFKSATLSVHHDWQKIRDYFVANPAPVLLSYAVEDQPLGTGGAIAYALAQTGGTTPVVVLNGDTFVQVDYKTLYAQHCRSGAPLTMVLRSLSDTGRYGRVMEKEGVITAFAPGELGKPGLINAGVYVVNPDLFRGKGMPAAFSFEQDFLPSRIVDIRPRSFLAEDYFIDIGIPEDYERANSGLPEIIKELA